MDHSEGEAVVVMCFGVRFKAGERAQEKMMSASLFGSFLVLVVFLAVVLGAIFFAISATQKRECPNCGHPLPTVRKPENTRQVMWGGWTCPSCRSELDRRGEIITKANNHELSGGLTQSHPANNGGELSVSKSTGSLALAEASASAKTDAVELDFDAHSSPEDATEEATASKENKRFM